MKNSVAAILLALALAFVAFVAGYYFGHNANDADVYISGYQSTAPTTPQATSSSSTTSPAPTTTPSLPSGTQPSSTYPTQPTTPTSPSADTTPTEPTAPPESTPPTEPSTTQPTQPPTTATKPAMTLENMAPININTASQEALELLPGIGPKKAAAIIQYRQEIGGFRCVEELLEVSGIGEKTFEKLLPYITV